MIDSVAKKNAPKSYQKGEKCVFSSLFEIEDTKYRLNREVFFYFLKKLDVRLRFKVG